MSGKNYLSIYAKSFNWAGFFLPKDTYKKCSDLYDFCRFLDNIADEPHDIQKKRQEFINFKNNKLKKGNYKNDFDYSNLRWTVDESEDLEVLRKIVENFNNSSTQAAVKKLEYNLLDKSLSS